jgi:hypothetical protein
MRAFISYLTAYLRTSSRPVFFITIFFVATLVYINYTFGIEHRIQSFGPWYFVFGGFFLFYSLVLVTVWGLQAEWSHKGSSLWLWEKPNLVKILLLAPFFFAVKMLHWDFSALMPRSLVFPWARYWPIILQLPAKLLLLLGLLWACRRAGFLDGVNLRESVGLTTRGFNARPYFLLVLLLIPVIALASTQPDFLLYYPKVKNIAFLYGYTSPVWPWKLLYEISYGLDFLSIELFFRGLLVIGLVRYAGQDAILPMAAFYCTVHFGKPLGECITSFFGGLALGVLAYRTRSILGGLIVHLGLAWMMELGGWVGGLA